MMPSYLNKWIKTERPLGEEYFPNPLGQISLRTALAFAATGAAAGALGLAELWRIWELSSLIEMHAEDRSASTAKDVQLYTVILLYVVIQPGLTATLLWLRNVTLGSHTNAALRRAFWHSVLTVPFTTVHRSGVGYISGYSETYPSSIMQIATGFFSEAVYFIAFVGCLIFLMSAKSVSLLLPIGIWTVLMIIIAASFSGKIKALATEVNKSSANLTGAGVNFLSNYSLVRSMHWDDFPKRRVDALAENYAYRLAQANKLHTIIIALTNAVNGIAIAIGAVVLVNLSRDFSLANAVFFVPLMLHLSSISSIAFATIVGVFNAYGYLEALRRDMNKRPASCVYATKSDRPNGAVSASALTLLPPGSSDPVLRDTSFEVSSGEAVGLVGPSGAGKSTLMMAVSGLIPISGGTLDVGSAAERMAFCTQEAQVFDATVRENLRFGNDAASDSDLLDALRLVELDDPRYAPTELFDLDTQIGPNGVSLSGGQKQRLALARAFLTRPEILMLDEALAGTEEGMERRLLSKLRKLLPDTTLIISSHRLSSLAYCERVLHIRDRSLVSLPQDRVANV